MSDINSRYYFAMADVLILSLKDQASYNALKSLRIDYSFWPNSDIKNALSSFHGAITNGYEAAKAITYAKHGNLIKELKNSAKNDIIPTPLLLDNLREGHNQWWADKIINSIKANPATLDQILNEYQKNKPSENEIYNLKDEIQYLVNENIKRSNEGNSLVVIPDFPILSDMIQGFNPAQITLLTAMSGVGKTSLCVALAASAAKIMDVLFINMEMDRYEFGSRFIYNNADITNIDWRKGNVSESTIKKAIAYEASLNQMKNIFYSGGKAMTLEQIKNEIYKLNYGGLVFIDYDQKIIMKSRDEEWKYLLDALTDLEEVAKRTNTHIIVVSQSNEQGYAKASKRMTQPCTNVLNFYKEGDGPLTRHFIRQLKSRYNTSSVLEVMADLAKCSVKEMTIVSDTQRGGRRI